MRYDSEGISTWVLAFRAVSLTPVLPNRTALSVSADASIFDAGKRVSRMTFALTLFLHVENSNASRSSDCLRETGVGSMRGDNAMLEEVVFFNRQTVYCGLHSRRNRIAERAAHKDIGVDESCLR